MGMLGLLLRDRIRVGTIPAPVTAAVTVHAQVARSARPAQDPAPDLVCSVPPGHPRVHVHRPRRASEPSLVRPESLQGSSSRARSSSGKTVTSLLPENAELLKPGEDIHV